MFKITVAVVAAALISTAAYAADCRSFALETDAEITLSKSEDGQSITLSDRGEVTRFDVVIEKLWGELTEVAVSSDARHPMRVLDVGGKPALVFSSTVFRPTCK